MPSTVTLRLRKLPAGAKHSDDRYRADLQAAVVAREEAFGDEARKARLAFLGPQAVKQQSPLDRPRTHEPRRQLSPGVACRHKWARIEALRTTGEPHRG